MNIRSLLLGSVAAAGLSTGAYAADLGVLTSLDVCDALGLSGLTISSDTNCLQISGAVSYEFVWGDYKGNNDDVAPLNGSTLVDHIVGVVPGGNGRVTISEPGFWLGHFVGELTGVRFLPLGPINFGPAIIGTVVVLFLGFWLSMFKQETKTK